MRAEDAQKLATSTLDELAAALERGQSAQLKAFLAAAARFHSYSFRNVMLIAAQYPEATRVAGFNAWRKLGRFVKKGEKGTRPVLCRTSTTSGVTFTIIPRTECTFIDAEPLATAIAKATMPTDPTQRKLWERVSREALHRCVSLGLNTGPPLRRRLAMPPRL